MAIPNAISTEIYWVFHGFNQDNAADPHPLLPPLNPTLFLANLILLPDSNCI